jgi:hypothetical protein
MHTALTGVRGDGVDHGGESGRRRLGGAAGMTRRLAIAAVALGVPLLTADAASACSCVPLKPRAALKAADGAFVGRLLEVREVDPPAQGEPIGTGDPMDYVYRVGRVYKRGPGLRRGRTVRVRSVRSEASCGLPDSPGDLFGIFAYRKNHRWHSNLCLTTTRRRMRRALDPAASRAGSRDSGGCG